MSRKNVAAETPVESAAVHPPVLSDIQVEAIGRETGEPGWMVDARRAAFERYRRMDMPTAWEETWRNSDLLSFPFSELPLEALAVPGKPRRPPAFWLKPAAGAKTGGRLALEDRTVHTAVLDDDLTRKGVIFLPIIQAVRDHPELVRRLMESAADDVPDVFTALASIIFDVGFLLHVPKGVRIDRPLHSLLWSSGDGLRASRLLIDVGEGAEVSLLHECASPERNGKAARLEILDLIVHRGATLRFFMTQAWGGNAVRIAREKAVIHRDGRLIWGFAHLGTRSAKAVSSLDLAEEGASAQWSGLYLLDGDQRADSSMRQNHLAANTSSDFLGKSILLGRAQSRTRGMVRVSPEASGADGYQGNRILILSDEAKADVVPGLEILSDDVRCSHGVTVGGLDPEEVFYLRSRGLSEEESLRLLMKGFLEGVLGRIPDEEIHRRVQLAADGKMKTMEAELLPTVKTLRSDSAAEKHGAQG
jgi:Fe-S cluster assembly protein SufD